LVGSNFLYTSKDYGVTWVTHGIFNTQSIYVSHSGDIMWVGRNSASNNFYFSTDHGNTFNVGNTAPDGSYTGMTNDCIACSDDGSIVASGSINGYYINTCRESTTDVRTLSGGTGISLTHTGSGSYTIASTISASISAYTYFSEITLTGPNNNLTLPATMDLFKYDYEMDFTINNIVSSSWFYLRFNNDSGLSAWSSTLFFHPNGQSGTTSIGLYNNGSVGSSIYWLNGGSHSGYSTLKATYRISAHSSTQFGVYLMQHQPANFVYGDNINAGYLVFASQIFYNYTTNNSTRWCPTSMNIIGNTGSFSTGRCLIRQVIKSSSYL
jgi:hypothetical protein